jgi:hypothetical protein
MEALAARGEVAEALAAYEALRVLLRDELGMAPGAAIRALHERLLAGESTPSRRAPTHATPQRVPLPALMARERGELVGRERELESLRRAWQDARAGTRRLVLLAGGHLSRRCATTFGARRSTAPGSDPAGWSWRG